MNVTVWAHHGCEVCDAVIARLVLAEVRFDRVNLVHTPELTEHLRRLGITEMPVVEAGGIIWAGDLPDRVAELRRRLDRRE